MFLMDVVLCLKYETLKNKFISVEWRTLYYLIKQAKQKRITKFKEYGFSVKEVNIKN